MRKAGTPFFRASRRRHPRSASRRPASVLYVVPLGVRVRVLCAFALTAAPVAGARLGPCAGRRRSTAAAGKRAAPDAPFLGAAGPRAATVVLRYARWKRI